MATWRCSGDGPGTHEACAFRTHGLTEAQDHHEATGHAVDREHERDADCEVDPRTDSCRACGVYHGDPCPACGGRGFHVPDCSEAR